MKKFLARSVATLAIIAGVGLVAPMTAFASGHTPPYGSDSTVTTTPSPPYKNGHLTLSSYRAARQAINQSFKSAVQSAQQAFQLARSQASTASARSQASTASAMTTARAAFELALIQAAAARDSALNNLGKPPGSR